jgi:hypothetical protein
VSEEPLAPPDLPPDYANPAPPALPAVMTTAPGTPGPLPHEPDPEPGKQRTATETQIDDGQIADEQVREIAAVPRNTSPPAIAGEAKPGEELTATPGTWANEPESSNGLWFYVDDDGKPIEVAGFGGGGPYLVKTDDIGKRVVFAETTENRFGESGVALSEPSEVIVE